jgi:hypothetical protein
VHAGSPHPARPRIGDEPRAIGATQHHARGRARELSERERAVARFDLYVDAGARVACGARKGFEEGGGFFAGERCGGAQHEIEVARRRDGLDAARQLEARAARWSPRVAARIEQRRDGAQELERGQGGAFVTSAMIVMAGARGGVAQVFGRNHFGRMARIEPRAEALVARAAAHADGNRVAFAQRAAHDHIRRARKCCGDPGGRAGERRCIRAQPQQVMRFHVASRSWSGS